ncbi:DVU_1553 family AMP-dependent CoA ligase [Breoghania sp. JC706]|uniref:DVU_1553 family AMP-dependent CoA ligase n=1 Tax=Breoghania sp. JC706 TaxID=3117732 RepID=UPI00300838C9
MMDWAARRMEVPAPLTAEKRDAYQLARIRETVAHARRESPFYRTRRKWPDALPETLADVARLPFTWPQELARNDPPFIATPRSAIARMVTLQTSGTSGPAKRIAFTAQDVEDTTDYFRHGMAQFTRPGDRVGIAFPAARPGSIGEDLVNATRRLGALPLAAPADAFVSAEALLAWIRAERPDVLFGAPVPFLAAARLSHVDGGAIPAVRAALISSDTASPALVSALGALWGCEVFDHWGMTETGYGGALDCPHHAGAHIRETDLYLEAIDPLSGAPVPAGEEGEIVLTTLCRTAVPLIRYRTGDLARIVDTPCECGLPFRRLVGLGRRVGGAVPLGGGAWLSRADMDDALFAGTTVTDYAARLDETSPPVLGIVVAAPGEDADISAGARQALLACPAIGGAVAAGGLRLDVRREPGALLLPTTGKRGIARLRHGPVPRAVLFDLDGTLVHTQPAVVAALNETLATFGLVPLSDEAVLDILGGGAGALVERAARLQGRELSPDEREAMVARYLSLYPDHEAALSAPLPEAGETMRAIARQGRKVAVVTNKRTRDAQMLLDCFGLRAHAQAVVGGDPLLSGKPAPDLLLVACRRLDCAPHDALFVGDGPEDREAARVLDMPFVRLARAGARALPCQPRSCPPQPIPAGRSIADLADLPRLIMGEPLRC